MLRIVRLTHETRAISRGALAAMAVLIVITVSLIIIVIVIISISLIFQVFLGNVWKQLTSDTRTTGNGSEDTALTARALMSLFGSSSATSCAERFFWGCFIR